MSEPITVTGVDIWDIRRKLGIRIPEYGISFSGDVFKPQFHVTTPDASSRFISPQQAVSFLRMHLMNSLRSRKQERAGLKKQLRSANRAAKKTRRKPTG